MLSPFRQRWSSFFWLSSSSSRAEDTNCDKPLVGRAKTSSPPLTRYGGPRSGTTRTRMTTPSLLSPPIPTNLHLLQIGIAGRAAIGALGQWEEALRVLHPAFPCSEVRRLEGSHTCLVLGRPFRLWWAMGPWCSLTTIHCLQPRRHRDYSLLTLLRPLLTFQTRSLREAQPRFL